MSVDNALFEHGLMGQKGMDKFETSVSVLEKGALGIDSCGFLFF